MKGAKRLTRRRFMQMAAAAAAASPMLSCSSSQSPWRFFTVQEARTLQAICEQVIPADKDPGAKGAGVVNYIDRQLMGHFKRHQKTYREGLAAVDETTRALFSRAFVELTPEQQVNTLEKLEKDEVPAGPWKGRSAKRFFGLVVEHAMQGFYGDPRHGGNRNEVSWRMLGVPYPPIRGRLQYDLTKPENGKPA
jgi:gluconate 2-dehydrogenase gamma chain